MYASTLEEVFINFQPKCNYVFFNFSLQLGNRLAVGRVSDSLIFSSTSLRSFSVAQIKLGGMHRLYSNTFFLRFIDKNLRSNCISAVKLLATCLVSKILNAK